MFTNLTHNKIAVIGAGNVGSTAAYALMISGIASEIVLIDIDKDKAMGEAMDLNHGTAFVKPVIVKHGDYSDCQEASIIIITAGANQKPGETRLDLLGRNIKIYKDIIPNTIKYNDKAIYIIVTNPVDILTYVTWKMSGLPVSRVIGSGTVLDTSRFRYLISQQCGIAARNVHAYIIGEHGDTEVPIWSLSNIVGIGIDEYCLNYCRNCDRKINKEEIFFKVKNAAYEIIEKKGATYYAVGLAIRRIVEGILRDENSIMTVSSVMQGYYGVHGIALSLPSVINRKGVSAVLELPLTQEEQQAFYNSGERLKKLLMDAGDI